MGGQEPLDPPPGSATEMMADQELKLTRSPLIILDLDMREGRVGRVEKGSSVSSCGCPNVSRIPLRPSLGRGGGGGGGLERDPLFDPVVLGLFSGLSPWATSCLSLNKFDSML